jgi:Fic family protein
VRAFIPDPLPPSPPLNLDARLQQQLESALLALGRLDGVSALLPDLSLFLYAYVRKEAVLSSQLVVDGRLIHMAAFQREE